MYSTMSRNTVAGFALVTMMLSACSEQTTSPKSRYAPEGAPNLDVIVNRMAADSSSADFTVTPTGGTFVIGPHAIHFPANSICDPATSSYGVTEWDEPCEPATSNIEIHAEVRHIDGYDYVDFTPSLRFVPSQNPSAYVWMLMKTSAATNADIRTAGILWAPALGAQGINETASDSTLRTYVYPAGGVVFRRIKHFSGYTVSDGPTEGTLVRELDVQLVDIF